MPAATELSVGDAAPDFALPDETGKVHKLSSYRGKTVVLYFYPKDNTPGCTQEACDLRDSHAKFKRKDAVVLGVSPDNEASHAKFKGKFELPFPLLADVDRAACEAYGVWQEKSLYGRKFMGVVRSTFVIGPNGKLTSVLRKVKVAGHAADLLMRV
ncbi:MAG: thioredoxin-dependent thiol peroxidase [Elusimicrobia bacterium]|nr:thioredoxin-dependent thiol peroxidase [Elusimicrobiota bacterium]